MKIKFLLIFGLLIILTSPIYAQRKIQKMDSDKQQKDDEIKKNETEPLKDRIKYGGGIWASFGTYSSYFLLQPFIAYKVNDRFLPGVGFTYIYISQTYAFNSSPISDNAYGLNIFAKEQIAGPLALYAEYSPINYTGYNSFGDSKRMWEQQFFLGGGLYQQHSYVVMLYDLLWKNVSTPSDFYPFRNTPLDFRVGFVF